MNKLLTLFFVLGATSAYANEVPIEGSVSSKCSVYTDTPGVYGNPTSSTLSTDPTDGGVDPIVRYDVVLADAYKAKISWPMDFSSSPVLNDALAWSGSVTVSQVSDAGMSAYETGKVMYDNVTEYDLTIAGSTWFKVESEVAYGVDKSLPGGTYKASVIAECIAK